MVADPAVGSALRRRWRLVASAAAYATALGIVLLWPVHVDGAGGLVRSEPAVGFLEASGVPAWASYPWLEFVANAALFAPLGALWAVAVRDPAARDVAAAGALGAAVSAAAEFLQGLFISQRTVDVRDVIANTVGALVGALALVVLARMRRRRRGAAREASVPVTADHAR